MVHPVEGLMDPDPPWQPGEEPPRPWVRLAMYFTLLAVGALFTITIAVILLSPKELLTEVTLRGERGLISEDFEILSLAPGERVRLEIGLGRPSAILVLLEDPAGALSEIHPQAGDATLLPGPAVLLPLGEDRAWNTADLEPGNHTLWILASPEPILEEERAQIRTRVEELVRRIPLPVRGRADCVAVEEKALEPRQLSLRRFQVHPR